MLPYPAAVPNPASKHNADTRTRRDTSLWLGAVYAWPRRPRNGQGHAVLAEHEVSERGVAASRSHLAEARLPVGKTLATFDFEAVPMVSKAQVMAA